MVIDLKYTHNVLLLHGKVISICFHDETTATQLPFCHLTIDTDFLKDQKQLNAGKAPREIKAATLPFIPESTVQVNVSAMHSCLSWAEDRPDFSCTCSCPKSPSLSLGCFTLFLHNIHIKTRTRAADSCCNGKHLLIFLINWHWSYAPQLLVLPLAHPQWGAQNWPEGQWKVDNSPHKTLPILHLDNDSLDQ